ncbi:fungal-specific transcription factor domain-containing protein [Desarmillaria tabescens]|uniref:Fungal-specific transcription factor domain-containing protein n=1 Tax=Armillaria tabescens TaxID=1929756 RepID=A0AA39MUS6_ARMTA|nr:fungal-specific transcription factor domain-containing protein [Desarmillaria tabescens]KAK0447392.1 fungal-specific transcription factor domain-containing protein [Desarmillaria tabescens]
MSSQSPVEHRPSPTSQDASPGENNTDVANLTHKESVPAGEKRVPLACHRCRIKRARCSGERPVCRTCAKVGEECTWPSGRRRKRTRKEMEEEERRQKERDQMTVKDGKISEDPKDMNRDAMSPSLAWANIDQTMSAANMWDFPTPVSSSSYIWPTPGPSAMSQTPTTPIIPFPQLSGQPEKQTVNLVRALESQVAYIDGDPTNSDGLELYYYRFSGSTAIHPGINRISLKLQPKAAGSSASAPVPGSQSKPGPPEPPEQVFDDAGLPLPHIRLPLLDTFFSTMSPYFPSVNRKRMELRLETGTMSAFLLNCICAVSARFHPSGTQSPAKACAPFITKAQELIIPLLHLPTTDVVTGLLLLSWANFGQNSESGLWQYSGIAIRMALDLGLHEISEIYESLAHVVRTRLLFWNLFITDRILAFSTGRPPSISEEIIEIPLPTDEDFFPDPASCMGDPHEEIQPIPFQHWVRLMVLCGRIANVLNGRRGRLRTLVGPSEPSVDLLSGLQGQLVQFYADLPGEMKWSVENFRKQEARNHGGPYLTLHLWANAVMTLVYHPELLTSPSGMETPLSQNMDRSIKLSMSSARTISECLVFADLFASQSYLSSPFTVQPIYVACLAFIHDLRISSMMELTQKPPTAELLLTSLARQNLSALIKAIQHMEHYWAGISYVSGILDSKTVGLAHVRVDPSKKTFISLPDKGLLRRFTTSDLKLAPPTETSLWASMAKEAAEASTCSLEDLLRTYSVEGFYVQPADSFDLQSLLGSGIGTSGRAGSETSSA